MSLSKALQKRSKEVCELCGGNDNLTTYEVPNSPNLGIDSEVATCEICLAQIEQPDKADLNHWRCLNDSMWSQVPAVQVVAWRMLYQLKAAGWPQDLLDMLYLDEETMAWAKAGVEAEDAVVHLDSNGAVLKSGDTVILTKTLNVKGASLTAKRGTAVRRISLVYDNPEHIEGRVNGQQIVILTKFVKKQN